MTVVEKPLLKVVSDRRVKEVPKEKEKKGNDSILASLPPLTSLTGARFPVLVYTRKDTVRMVPMKTVGLKNDLNDLVIKNNFTRNVLGHFFTAQETTIDNPGIQNTSYFELFEGRKIASIRFVRLEPFGSSIHDTTKISSHWIEKTGNSLHMNTSRIKLRNHLLFQAGDPVNPLLMAENEKLMRDLNYIEDVMFRLEPNRERPEEVDVTVISKDKFEYAVNLNINADNSDIQFVNENMFGLGHRLTLGFAQKNEYLPEMGIYSSYQVQNILGQFINASVGYSDTYLKKDWNFSVDKKFLTSLEENAGGFSLDNVSKFNYIAEDHPIELDTTVAYLATDAWFIHAFPMSKNMLDKTLVSFRYYHQKFDRTAEDSFGESEFLRNHDFFLTGVTWARRKLYKNNQVYGYGVTEDIPYGYYYEIKTGLDKSQFGTWPYFGFSLSRSTIGKEGSYYSGKLAMDGFLDEGSVKQGTILLSGDYFSKKRFVFNDPWRGFVKMELLSGINRLEEEYITIDGRFGIRDFYTSNIKGKNRFKINLEAVRYLKWNFYGFRFTHYYYTDLAFLSDRLRNLFSTDFYAGLGTGLRIYNESLLFKIIDIRLSWFPVLPPEEMSHFGMNLQGLSKSRFEDFLGRKPEVIRFE